jgi:ABC-2 type transport system ATP-binding protein
MPDSGTITVLGLNPSQHPEQLHEQIGVQLQTTSIQPNIKVKEAIYLFASLYLAPAPHPEQLLAELALEGKANSRFKHLSGGQKQRLAIALALVNDPEVLFLDEISTGLDPQARRKMWQLIRSFNQQGKTIFLTTHYMEEAEQLCDRVGIIDYGQIIALDTPANLIRDQAAEAKVLFKVYDGRTTIADLAGISSANCVEQTEDGYILFSNDGDAAIMDLVRLADKKGFKLRDIHSQVSNLDDVFLTLTGKEYRE